MNNSQCSSVSERPAQPLAGNGNGGASFAAVAKRGYDIVFSFFGLFVLSPLLLLIAILIKASDGGPVLYRQERVGWRGKPFLIWKFRTMVPRADQLGPSVTRGGDRRITRIGRLLRGTKLDELPQLWNVLKGDMSLVGPRPEVASYVAQYTPQQRQILDLKPGITDLASLHFRNEETLLKHADDLETFYLQHCVPRKVHLNLEYAQRATLLSDTWIILQTVSPYWICLLTLYTLVLATAFWASCHLVYDFSWPPHVQQDFLGVMLAFVAVQLGALIWRKQCKGLLSYFSLQELRQTALALLFACSLLLGLWALADRPWPSRNVILVDAIVALVALGGLRLLFRFWRERSSVVLPEEQTPPVRVGIIGAGYTGSMLARELMMRRNLGRTVVAFFDDDFQKWHRCIHEIPVVGMPECLLDGWARKVDEVVVALPSASHLRLRQITDLVKKAGLRAYQAPSALDIWAGNGGRFSGDPQL
jgi:lipopolysaccharide/colanic/teichoic acid biosynthesis glycosyltransferase